jgi:glycosidase
MGQPLYPSLYQVNTRVHLQELGQKLNRPATLDDVPDADLDRWAALGFDWVWLLGVWQTGTTARDVSRSNPDWRKEYQAQLPDLKEEDISGSPFAIQSYVPHKEFGGRDALLRIRDRLKQRGLRLLLDFVPNHVAPDHPWRFARPEYFVHGTADDLRREPHNYLRVLTKQGPTVLAHGRDPYFPGWPDTLQLNYRHAGLRAAQIETLSQIGELCDGVRCDMAMLVLPDVIARTWGDHSRPTDNSAPVDTSFWPEALAQVRARHPGFVFMAEVYWDLEWELQQQGFDYTYDKRLYDRLRDHLAEPIRQHLWAGLDFQRRSVRFLENHDEPRAAETFPPEVHRPASIIAFLTPGLRFFHEGQLEGRRTRVSMHLGRRRPEPADGALQEHYRRLLELLKRPELRDGRWALCDCRQPWADNPTWNNYVAFSWQGDGDRRLLVAVNYGPTQGQANVLAGFGDLPGRRVGLSDLTSPASFERDGTEMATQGLFVDLPAWGYHVFELTLR